MVGGWYDVIVGRPAIFALSGMSICLPVPILNHVLGWIRPIKRLRGYNNGLCMDNN